jgi:H+-transporting ATPase
MGINVKMITGDHVVIAKEIANRVNLGQNMALPKDFIEISDEKASSVVESVDGFAEVFPEHKYQIVKLLKEKNHIVGMTGDGVNDAPALRKADVGIAVQGSTDVAKSAADIVLTGSGISVIIDAIRNSRKIFQRMSNYSTYRIAESIRVILFIAASILFFQFYPVNAIMIVLLALLNDLPIITIAYDNVKYSNNPEVWDSKMLLGMATFLGIIGVTASFGILIIGDTVFHLSRVILQSFIYLKLSVAGHLTLLVARTRGPFWSVRPGNALIAAILGTQFVATLITVYGFLLPAMGWGLALFVWGYAIVWFLITDVLKTAFYKHGGLEMIEEIPI